jgi:uncharacterized protein (DUF433 family)
MPTAIEQSHLVRDDQGVLRLGGLKYLMFLFNHVRGGMDVPALVKQYPSLTLGQIYAGLAYYHDHKADLDAELKQREEEDERLLNEFVAANGGLREKLIARLTPEQRSRLGV